jgi:hypothetical protein
MKVIITENQFRRIILKEQSTPSITINDSGVKGTYIGPSKNPGDKTHAFANTISTKVGEKLKDLYDKQIWTKVDLDGIKLETVIDKSLGTKITTNGGDVKFTIDIPFIQVNDECEAYTSFGHRGGWGHNTSKHGTKYDAIVKELATLPAPGTKLDISRKKTTPEGLVEYFAQWKNPAYQSKCKDNTQSSSQEKTRTFKVSDPADLRDVLRNEDDNEVPTFAHYKDVKINGNNITITFDPNEPRTMLTYIHSGIKGDADIMLGKVRKKYNVTKVISKDVGSHKGYILLFKEK